jgi:hypothetical protein
MAEPEINSDSRVKAVVSVGLSAERLARALALNYYQGCYRERYGSQKELTRITGFLVVGTAEASLFIEQAAKNDASRFWTQWESEAAQLLLSND